MKTKAQRRSRAGRKPKDRVERYPSGEVKHPSVAEVRATVADARQRLFGVSAAEAVTQEAGTAIGRLGLEGRLGDKDQCAALSSAAKIFRERRHAADMAIGSRHLTTSTNYVGGRGGFDGSDGDDQAYVERCNTARRRYAEVRRAVLECGDSYAMFAIEQVVIEDREPIGDDMVGSLRCGLNAVHRVLQYDRKAA